MLRNVKRLALLTFSVLLLAVFAHASEKFRIQRLDQIGASHVFIQWDEYDGADGYSLYRSEENSPFRLIKNVSSTTTHNYGLANGRMYSYVVRPYKLSDNGERLYLCESACMCIQIGVNVPQKLTACTFSKNSVQLNWLGDPLADYYLLYRSTDNISWTVVKRVCEQNTVTYGLIEGQTYFFKVRAVRKVSGVVRSSDCSDPAQCVVGVAAPNSLTYKNAGKNFVQLQWDAVPGATGYRLYRADGSDEYKLIKTVRETTTKNYNLDPRVTYTYRIAAILDSGSYVYKSKYTYAKPIRLSLETVKQMRIERVLSGGVTLSWESIEGATGYRIYRVAEQGKASLVKTVSQNKTTTYSLAQGQCYRFSVKPICQNGEAVINADESEPLAVFFTALLSLEIAQHEVNKVCLHWNKIAGAEKYILKITSKSGTEITQELKENSAKFAFEDSCEISASVWAIKNGYKSAGASATFVPVYEDTLAFTDAEVLEGSGISLSFESIDGVVQYEVQRSSAPKDGFVTVGLCEETGFVDASVLPNTEYRYRYRAKYAVGKETFWGSWSDVLSITTPGRTCYRALLIGEENYETVLNGPANDIHAMNEMLCGMTSMDWTVYLQADATKDEIISLVSLAFADATENDVSLFYYSGHGVTGSGEAESGALMTVDYDYIYMQELAELLSAVPGKVVVVLDSCGSGAAISGKAPSSTENDPSRFEPLRFNEEVIRTFSRYSEKTRSAELATDKFYVLTSSAYEQNSHSACINDMWGGVFTRAFVGCVGYDYQLRSWNERMDADTDADDCVTLNECYIYCRSETSAYQDVQAYPIESSVGLFYR